MRTLKSLREIQDNQPLGLIIGNFDGVHAGHKWLLKRVKEDCDQLHLDFTVMTFVPHPRLILAPENIRGRLLADYKERRNLLSELHVKNLVEVDFSRDFSTLSPREFVENYLRPFNVKKIYLGHDFCFGSNKEGSFKFLKNNFGEVFDIAQLEPFYKDDQLISSSLIRQLLLKGDISSVMNLLERPYLIKGKVIKGRQMGRKIGFPTANLLPDSLKLIPSKGVYVTQTKVGGVQLYSITNVGHNPTVNSKINLSIETHILNFDSDIYGEDIEVNFFKKLRDEHKYDDVQQLVEQIGLDIEGVKRFFSVTP